MIKVEETTQGVLDKISEGFEQKGAYNLRQNGISVCHGDSEHIKIRKKEDKPGIDIFIDGKTQGEKVFIPVVVSVSGMTDLVYAMKAVTMAFTPSMLEKMPMFIMKRSITAKEMEPEAGS